jgi:hypothetical protein
VIDVVCDVMLCKLKIDHNDLKQMFAINDYAMSLYHIRIKVHCRITTVSGQ